MSNNFDIDKFKKYFHYGLEYEQEDILDGIIIRCSKDINKMNLKAMHTNMNNLEYTMDVIKNVYVQFERFIKLTADDSKYWYKKVSKDDVNDLIMKRIEYLKKNNLICVVTYKPMYGIYTTDRSTPPNNYNLVTTGLQRYENIPKWIRDDMVPILLDLAQLEQENPYQYNSLFLDTKYARSINCGNQSNLEKIESVYALFMESVKPAKEDIYNVLEKNISIKDKKHIEANYADYWTITDLKEQAKTDKYMEKVHACYKSIKNLQKGERFED